MALRKSRGVGTRSRRPAGAESTAGLSDRQLLERFAATGDDAVFETIVARFGPMILGVCRRMLYHEADVEDVFQATFLVLVRKLRTLGGGVPLGHWLYGVALRVALRARSETRRRYARERPGPPDERDGPAISYEEDPGRFEIKAVLDNELGKLPAKYRMPIVLCYLEGLTHDEAAVQLGWPVGSVKGRLARGRDLLRQRLTRRGLTVGTGAIAAALACEAAAVPAALVRATCQAASQVAAGKPGAGAAAAAVAALVRHGLRAPVFTPLKAAGAAAGLVLLVAAGLFGLWAKSGSAPARPQPPGNEPRASREIPRARPIARAGQRLALPAGTRTPATRRPARTTAAVAPEPALEAERHAPAQPRTRGPGAGATVADAAPIAPDLAAANAPRAHPAPPVWSEYDALKARTGRGADAEVRLALWCEEHGLLAQRHQHLARAVLLDAHNARARGLMGRVQYRGRWVAPDAAADAARREAQQSAGLAEYNARRVRLDAEAAAVKARVAEGEKRVRPAALAAYRARHSTHRDLAIERLKLALWCEKAGLNDEATVEFSTAIHLDPRLDEPWRHLGYVRHDGRWMQAAEAEALQNEAWAQSEANDRWVPALLESQASLRDPNLRQRAEDQLAQVTDPRAVPAIRRVFCEGRPIDDQARAIGMLRRIDTAASTKLLAMLAVCSEFDDIRRAAREVLPVRLPRDYLETLVLLIHTPARFAVSSVQGPGSSGLLVVETPRYHLERSYDAPPPFSLAGGFRGYVGYDVNGLPVAITGNDLSFLSWVASIPLGSGTSVLASGLRGAYLMSEFEHQTAAMIAAAHIKAAAAQQWLVNDIRDLEQSNAQTVAVNARVSEILRASFDAPDLKDDEDAWNRWYYDRIGYSYTPPPQVSVAEAVPNLPPPTLYSCFSAGTLVRTLEGQRPIEEIGPGEKVLSQDTATGALGFEPVLVAHHNPPARTVRLTLDDGAVLIPSIYHRFWICGQGWTMARDLKPGDPLRALGSRTTIARAEPGAVVPVFNLDVAHGHTYFVGERDYLVHDNTLPGPPARGFDALGGPEEVPAATRPKD